MKEGPNSTMEFVKRCKVLKLRDDVTAGIFKVRVQTTETRAALVAEKRAGVKERWKNFKKCLIEEAVCAWGNTGNEKVVDWWNVEIAALLKEILAAFIEVVEWA